MALWKGGLASGGGTGALGLILLIFGPLAVGGVVGAVAGGHTKNVRDLAREIDRLGKVGDPSRTIRAHGAEASDVARATERMVAKRW